MKRFFAILFAAAFLAGCSDNTTTPQYEYDYLTFENVETKYLAGPTPAGENLYDSYAGDQYTGYSDKATGLKMWINEAPVKTDDVEVMACNFWNGGIAISRWNHMTYDGGDQCSVYNKNGGHNGSKTFGVVYFSAWGNPPMLHFENGETERVFDHFWVANSTNAVITMEKGSGLGARPLTYKDKDWLKLTIYGYNKAGEIREVEFFLADFRTSKAGGIVRKWTKVNLSALGAVNRLEFVITGSDIGEWGLNTPSYFCFDDVAIRREVLSGQ